MLRTYDRLKVAKSYVDAYLTTPQSLLTQAWQKERQRTLYNNIKVLYLFYTVYYFKAVIKWHFDYF